MRPPITKNIGKSVLPPSILPKADVPLTIDATIDKDLGILQDKLINIKDVRKVRRTTGQPLKPTERRGGKVSEALLKDIVGYAKQYKIDPYEAISRAIIESEGNPSYNNPFHLLYNPKTNPTISKIQDSYRSGVEAGIVALKQKEKEFESLVKRGKVAPEKMELLKLQMYNGLGRIFPNTEGGQGKFYGVSIPKEGIKMTENPLYAKELLDIMDIVKLNPDVKTIVEQAKPITKTTHYGPLKNQDYEDYFTGPEFFAKGGPVYNWIPKYPRTGAKYAQGGWLEKYANGGTIEDQRIPTPTTPSYYPDYPDRTLTNYQMGTPKAPMYAAGSTVWTKQTTPSWVAGTPTPTTTQREINPSRTHSPGTAIPYPEIKITGPTNPYMPASPPVLQGYNPYNGPMRLHAPTTTKMAKHGGDIEKNVPGLRYQALNPGVSAPAGMYVGPTTQRGITFDKGGGIDLKEVKPSTTGGLTASVYRGGYEHPIFGGHVAHNFGGKWNPYLEGFAGYRPERSMMITGEAGVSPHIQKGDFIFNPSAKVGLTGGVKPGEDVYTTDPSTGFISNTRTSPKSTGNIYSKTGLKVMYRGLPKDIYIHPYAAAEYKKDPYEDSLPISLGVDFTPLPHTFYQLSYDPLNHRWGTGINISFGGEKNPYKYKKKPKVSTSRYSTPEKKADGGWLDNL